MPENGWPADRIDTTRAHCARIYDYLIGGKDHYPPDVEAGDAMRREWPALPVSMRANRDFMRRAVRHLAAGEGVRQFLDIGSGLPSAPNLHEVAQRVDPACRVVYVDNDPIVLTLSQGLLTSAPDARTGFVDADLREPESILEAPALRETLDLDQPVAVALVAVLHFLRDDEDPYGLVRRLLEPLAPGSYLVLSTGTADFAPQEVARVAGEYAARGIPVRVRTRDEVTGFLTGLELVEPGLVQAHHWRPEPGTPHVRDADVAMYGAVARKPG